MASTDLLHLLQAAEESRNKEKSANALRTISEAAEMLDVPAHVLRFWETKFAVIKPLKRNGGRRFYRPEDIEVLQQIKHLLYRQGFTIKGAKKAIDEFAKIVSIDSQTVT
ncbi:MAG: MerR family transcriptional regulator, partial [Alphaproteobacteria bacterium]